MTSHLKAKTVAWYLTGSLSPLRPELRARALLVAVIILVEIVGQVLHLEDEQ